MIRHVVLALMIAATPALAKSPKTKQEPKHKAAPYHEVLELAAEACTPEGAFGHRFSRNHYGRLDAVAEEEWAPFTRLTVTRDEISAVASFHGEGESQEEDETLAKKFLHAFEKAAGKKSFPHKKTHSNGVELSSSDEPDTGLEFLIRQDDDHIIATCTNLDR